MVVIHGCGGVCVCWEFSGDLGVCRRECVCVACWVVLCLCVLWECVVRVVGMW